MAIYYIGSVVLCVVLIATVTIVVIHALNRKGDVSAGFWLNRLGFTLTAKDRSADISTLSK
jgi:hypothetical protein